MRMTILLALLGLVFPSLAVAQTREATVYKDPNCGCCTTYVHYLEQNGFKVTGLDRTGFSGGWLV